MKLLAFVDVHGNMSALKRLKNKAAGTDAVICAGDLSVFEAELDKLIGFLSSFEKPVLIIHGNHERGEIIKKECSKHNNVYFVHKNRYLLGDYLVIGYGGGGFSLEDNNFLRFVNNKNLRVFGIKNFRIFNNIRTNKEIILVTHAPPYGTRLDLVNGMHHGNKSITEFIKKSKPGLVVCGHFHENTGKKDKIGRTMIINPGPEGKIIKL